MSNLLTVDNMIVALYLLTTLIVGLYYGRGIKTMKDYVIGDRRHYSVPVLAAAVLATVVGDAPTIGLAKEVSSTGLIWAFVCSGWAIHKFIIAYYLAPHVTRFRNKLSAGEIMEDLYGKLGRVTTGIAGTIYSTGVVGGCIASIGYVFHYFFGLSPSWGIIIACGIVVVYAAFGGIRSVNATDLIQFAVLMIFIPVIACQALWHAGWYTGIYANAPVGHFDLLSHKDFWKYLFVFAVFSMPYLDPAYVQRFLMAHDARQAHAAWNMAGLLQLVIILFVTLIALAMTSAFPNLDSQATLLAAVEMLLSTGMKGVGIVGLFAVIMSTADSHLHAASVSLTHDVVQPLRQQALPDVQELKLTRIATLLLGLGSIGVAAIFKNIIESLLVFLNFWMPIIVIPLFAGMIGYRSSVRSFGIAALAGAVVTGAWKIGIGNAGIDATVPGLLANLIAFSIARQYDKPEELHFGQDELNDPRTQKYVQQLREKHAKRQRASWASCTRYMTRSGAWFITAAYYRASVLLAGNVLIWFIC